MKNGWLKLISMEGGNMAISDKPNYCNTEPNGKACLKRQKGSSGNRCRRECKYAKKK
jgi:hypothetical protein